MSTLNVVTALAQYNENVDWDGNVVKAKLALQALRFLRVNRAAAQAHAGASFSFSAIDSEIAEIKLFVGAADPSVRRVSYTSARTRLY